jgi:uncharacterized repeat protein (TIGR03803 family)
MQTRIKNLILLPVLIASIGLIPTGRVTAQTFTTLHSFTAILGPGTNSDGAIPFAGVILSGNTLYGTADLGGSSGWGTVFKVNTDGTDYTNLHSFSLAGNDGAHPQAGLILSGNILYGTTYVGGSGGVGTVFKVNTDGSGFTNVHNFYGFYTDGANPRGGLVLSGNTLYGTTYSGGSSGVGAVFAVNTDGTGFTNLYNFTALSSGTNSDGANPYVSLILAGSTLYGTTVYGGSSGTGAVFKVNTDGTGFTNLHNFTGGNDGANPYAGLILSGNTLYGTAGEGGCCDRGAVFAVNTDGTGFTNLHSFTYNDGALPMGELILSGNTLFGTTVYGGSSGNGTPLGTVFKINTDGTGFKNLHTFVSSSGFEPPAGLILSGHTLYGTTEFGGSSGNGTVFSLSFTPQLTIFPSGTNLVLTWPTNVAGFDYTGYTLQSTTNLSSSIWIPVVPGPVVVEGHYAVTNPISATQQFYRLIK